MAFYRELNRENDEVRMLTIVELPDDSKHSGLVHCKLEHVSFEDTIPQFSDLVIECGEHEALEKWVEISWLSGQLNYSSLSKTMLKIPLWRWTMHYGNVVEAFQGWNDLLDAMNINPRKCPKIPEQPHLKSEPPPKSKGLWMPMRFRYVPLIPRFKWGDFEAISYCWESDKRDKEIVVDGTLFKVPRNLEALLQKLRKLPQTSSGMKYWVDALCINQENTFERNHQVKLMKMIYSKAFTVIVWLGDFVEGSEEAINFIASITRFTFSDQRDERFDFEEWEKMPWGVDQKKSFSQLPWKPLLLFFTRSYWRRLWIIQELALNHNMTLFLCGDRQISRSMIQHTCNFCERLIAVVDRHAPPMPEIENSTRSSMYGSFWPVVYHINKLLSTTHKTGLEAMDTILDLGRKASVTDPRDKVYGLLGLLPETLSTTLNPDYTDTNLRPDVYQQFALAQLQISHRLDSILSWCSYKSSSSLPSWVPDWLSEFSRNRVQWLKRRKAGGTAPSDWSIIPASHCLRVRGIIFDSVSAVSAAQSENLAFGVAISCQPIDESDEISYHRYGSKDELSAALRRTLLIPVYHTNLDETTDTIFDIYWTDWASINGGYEENTRTRQIDLFWHEMRVITKSPCWKTFDQFRHTNAEFSIFGKSFRSFFPDINTYDDSELSLKTSRAEEDRSDTLITPIKARKEFTNMHISEMLTTVIALIGRRLITTNGGYLGLAPEEVQKGDAIAVLYGCSFPVVLRPSGGSYQVIGECYVDGVMDGEIIDARDRGEYKEVEISLC